MATENQIMEEVEKTLHSFDSDGILEDNPFLYTRLDAAKNGRMQRNRHRFASLANLKLIGLLLLLLANLITMLYYQRYSTQDLHERLVSAIQVDFQVDQSQNNF